MSIRIVIDGCERPDDARLMPGGKLSGRIQVDGLSRSCRSISITLEGRYTAAIMGKGRWAAGLSANSQGTVGPGAAVTPKYQETHCFLALHQTLWSTVTAEASSSGTKARSADLASAHTADLPFEIELPRNRQCTCEAVSHTLPVSCDVTKGTAIPPYDTSGIVVAYTLTSTVERTGLLHRNLKKKLNVLMTDDSPPTYGFTETNACKSCPLRFDAAPASSVPELFCELRITPPGKRGAEIYYTVTYQLFKPDAYTSAATSDQPKLDIGEPSRPPVYYTSLIPLLSSIQPRAEVHLRRSCTTRAIEHPQDGYENTYPPTLVVAGKWLDVPEEEKQQNLRDGRGILKGVLTVPQDEVTMLACGAEVTHDVNVRLISSRMMRPLMVSTKVFLPSV